MSNSPAFDAAALLVARGVVAASGVVWPIKLGHFTTDCNAQVAISDTPGLTSNPKWLLDYVTIGILVRGNPDGYIEAQAKAKAIKDALIGMNPVTHATGDRWDGVTELGSGPSYIGADDKSCPMFSLNFRIILEPVTNALTSRDPL